MTYTSAIILGIIQGLTEFLPISSSGHLLVLQNLFGISPTSQGHAFFSILLHMGTLISVCIVYRRDIRALIGEVFTMAEEMKDKNQVSGSSYLARRLLFLLIVSSLPLLVVLPFNSLVARLTTNSAFIGAIFLITGTMLAISSKLHRGDKIIKTMRMRDAVLIGFCQSVAIIPGLSRSGVTVTAGIAVGLKPEFAVKYAFILSIPAVLGANIIALINAISEGIDTSQMPVYLAGMAVASVVGIFTIGLVRLLVSQGKFGGFSYYCWTAGIVILILSLIF